MSQEAPKFSGKWEGDVIKILLSHESEFVNFKILAVKTGLSPNGLKSALHTLYNEKIIEKNGDRYVLIDESIKNDWRKFLSSEPKKAEDRQESLPEPKPSLEPKQIKNEENSLIQWIIHWANERSISFVQASKHFFLEGMRLEEFTRDVIGKAKDEILVTNPYVDSCYLTTALQEARDRRVNVRIVSRRPTKDKNDITKLECHATMRKKGITIHYINTIHAKIVIIDRKIAVLSSMNLYSGSAGGGVLEAGIVSYETSVVDSIMKYITGLLEKTESPDITSYNKYYGRR